MILVKRILQSMICHYNMTYRGSYRSFKIETQGREPYVKKTSQNKKVHVIANGPSANETIPYIKKGEDVIVVNYALREEKIRQLTPKKIVLLDPAYANQGYGVNYLGEVYNCIKDGVVENAVMSVEIYKQWEKKYPIKQVEVLNARSKNKQYIYNTKRDKKAFERNIFTPILQTVPIAALYIAIQDGYTEILLHGNDFDYFKYMMVDDQCHLLLIDNHFYESRKRDLTKETASDIEAEVASLLRALRGYKQVQAYSKDQGVTIYNVSMNSMLDMFEKKRIEDTL